MSEAQVIPDVRLQRAGGNVAGIRQAVRFDLVGPALDQSRRFFKIGDRVIETSQSDETMAAMSIQSSVSRESLDAFSKHTDCIFVTSEVRGASSEPDNSISGVSIFLIESPRLAKFCLKVASRFGRKLRRNFTRCLQAIRLRRRNGSKETEGYYKKRLHCLSVVSC